MHNFLVVVYVVDFLGCWLVVVVTQFVTTIVPFSANFVYAPLYIARIYSAGEICIELVFS